MKPGLKMMYEQDAEAFARAKVGAYGEQAVQELARCTRYIARALDD